jgi:hypothetical protein
MVIRPRISKEDRTLVQHVMRLPLRRRHGPKLWEEVDTTSNIANGDDACQPVSIFYNAGNLVHQVVALWLWLEPREPLNICQILRWLDVRGQDLFDQMRWQREDNPNLGNSIAWSRIKTTGRAKDTVYAPDIPVFPPSPVLIRAVSNRAGMSSPVFKRFGG